MSLLIFIGIVILIIVLQIWEFSKYYKKLNFNPMLPNKKLNTRKYKYNKLNNSSNYIIVQTKTGKPIQIIKGSKSFYCHYLNIKSDGNIDEKSVIGSDIDIDKMKKSGKDYRINFNAVRKAELLCERCMHILSLKILNNDKIFYSVESIEKEEFEKFFEGVRFYKYSLEGRQKHISVKESIKMLGTQKIFFIILRTLTFISMGASIASRNFEMNKISITAVMVCQIAMMIFYCMYSEYFTIKDVKRSEPENNIYSSNPNIVIYMIIPSLLLIICGIMSGDILEWERYFVLGIISSLAVAGILILFTDSYERKKIIFTAFMIAVLFCFGMVGTVNYYYDPSEPVVTESEVYDKYKMSGTKSTSYYLEVRLSNGNIKSLTVSYNDYNDAEIGDNVEIYEYAGLFDIPYAEIHCD